MRAARQGLRRATRIGAVAAMAATLAGCGGALPGGDDFNRIADKPIEERARGARIDRSEAVNFLSEEAVTVLHTGGSNAFRLTADPGQEVPEVAIGEINAAPMQFGPLLDQIAEQANMSWRISGPESQALLEKDIYFVQRSETMLATVLDEIAKIADAFYKIEGDRILFGQDRLFVVRVPRMADSQEVLTEGLGNIGATEIFADELSGTVTFRATRPAYKAARRLIRSLEQGRDMVVYDFWLIDRILTDSVAAGMDFNVPTGDDEGSDASVGGLSAIQGIVDGGADRGFVSGNLGNVGVEVTAQFLRSLGDTETVARPTISMLSGGESAFESGESSEYIRSVNSESTDNGTSEGTEVEELNVGVQIDVTGAHNSGVISTDFELEVSELLAFEEFDTGDTTLRLPRTSERTLEAHLEARPGDLMVLGGIIRDRQELKRREIAGTGIPTSSGRGAEKTETIILVRPRLVRIRPEPGAPGQGALSVEPGVGDTGLGRDGAADARAENGVAGIMAEERKARGLVRSIGK